jgi:hypothetical protein
MEGGEPAYLAYTGLNESLHRSGKRQCRMLLLEGSPRWRLANDVTQDTRRKSDDQRQQA